MKEIQFTTPISCHAWNGDRSQIAICPNNEEIHIYQLNAMDGSQLERLHVLKEHSGLVTGLDWNATTNQIVSCSQDRNAYVWSLEAKTATWKPALVLLRLARAATLVRWSPNGTKFAVGSSAACVSICYFEKEGNWWVSKLIRDSIQSTVTCLCWHPNNVLLAIGSTDMKVRVVSAYIKGLDEKPPANPWGDKLPFQTLCAAYLQPTMAAWTLDIAFSPSGQQLAWTAQDSSVCIAVPSASRFITIATSFLPLSKLLFIAEDSLIAAGQDHVPILFSLLSSGQPDSWTCIGKLDSENKSNQTEFDVFDKFKQLDTRGQSVHQDASQILSIHQFPISDMRAYGVEKSGSVVSTLSTSSLDGKLVLWKADEALSKFRQQPMLKTNVTTKVLAMPL